MIPDLYGKRLRNRYSHEDKWENVIILWPALSDVTLLTAAQDDTGQKPAGRLWGSLGTVRTTEQQLKNDTETYINIKKYSQ